MLDFTNTTTLNPILRTDSYKTSHFNQYPVGATRVSSYIEPRGYTGPLDAVVKALRDAGVSGHLLDEVVARNEAASLNEAVFFGLQAFIKAYLMTPITMDDVAAARDLYEAHGVPFNTTDWAYIVVEHGGYLPIEICAVPEGTVMGVRNVQVQVTNTDNALPWLTSYVETALLRAIWYPSTVATLSRRMKQFIYQGLVQTSDDPDGQINFKLHDFGARGATSSEAAMLGGMGHLVNFMGTDTVEAIVGARRFYGEPMAGFSIPATEHSTMTSWGRDREVDAYRNLLVKNPTGLVACVSDSYDIFNAVRHIWGEQLRDEVMAREGTLVIRPDSGNPTVMPLDIIELAMEKFGFTVNSKGFRVLPSQVRVIQGDGMDGESIPRLLQNAIDRGISVDNFAMGMGGGLLQKVNRDTMKYAMKANAIEIDGVWHDVYKDPITDQGKQSKKGRQALINFDGEFVTVREDMIPCGAHGAAKNYLRPVYRNGELLVDDGFATIRKRAAI